MAGGGARVESMVWAWTPQDAASKIVARGIFFIVGPK
jgi:hypothetical protein